MRRWWMLMLTVTVLVGAAQAQESGAGKFGFGTAGVHLGIELYFSDTRVLPLGFAFDGNSAMLGFDLEARTLLPLIDSDALFVYVYGGGGLRTENLFGGFGFTTTLGASIVLQSQLIGIYAEIEPINYLFGGTLQLFSRFNLGLALAVF